MNGRAQCYVQTPTGQVKVELFQSSASVCSVETLSDSFQDKPRLVMKEPRLQINVVTTPPTPLRGIIVDALPPKHDHMNCISTSGCNLYIEKLPDGAGLSVYALVTYLKCRRDVRSVANKAFSPLSANGNWGTSLRCE